MRFTKMHGLGNDYLFLDAFAEPGIALRSDLHQLAQRICDRHRGVGADGIIILAPPTHPDRAEMRARVLNADGSDGGVCGNGTRCAAKFVVDRGIVTPREVGLIRIDTGPRILDVRVHLDAHGIVTGASVDMGKPVFELERIPVEPGFVRAISLHLHGRAGDYQVDHRTASFVTMGNPHMVIFAEEPVEKIKIDDEGPRFESHPAFPQRINVHFVNVLARSAVIMRPWERGAGATLACASGACGVVAAGFGTGRLDRSVRVRMPGGVLDVAIDEETGHVHMTGEAVEVFSGDWRG